MISEIRSFGDIMRPSTIVQLMLAALAVLSLPFIKRRLAGRIGTEVVVDDASDYVKVPIKKC
jgi:hypothetical protein